MGYGENHDVALADLMVLGAKHSGTKHVIVHEESKLTCAVE
jgi:hypothetical protein